MWTVLVFQNFYENCKEYEGSLNWKAISIQIYNQMCNLLYRRLLKVPEHFTESPQLEKSLEVEGCPSPWEMFSSL